MRLLLGAGAAKPCQEEAGQKGLTYCSAGRGIHWVSVTFGRITKGLFPG